MSADRLRPTLAIVAQQAGVSRSTVSRALRDDPQITPATRERVKTVASAVGYRPDPVLADFASANALRRGDRRARTVNLAILDEVVSKEYRLQEFVRGIEDYAAEHAYELQTVLISEVDRPPEDIRGIILLDYGHHAAKERYREWLRDSRVPVVALSPNSYACPYDAVASNHVQAMHVLLETIAERGYRRPGLLLSAKTDRSSGHAWSAAYCGWLQRRGWSPAILQRDHQQAAFDEWIAVNDIDVVISRKSCRQLITDAAVPLGSVNLGVRSPASPTSGLLQNYAAVGAAAMRHLDGAIRRFTSGRPAQPQMVLVAQEWHEGETLPWRTWSSR